MRVALVVPGFSADEQDWCIPALLNLVREVARRHEVEVFTLRYPHRRGSYEVYGARVHAFGGALAAGVQRGPLMARALAAIVGAGRARRFDVVHGIWADEPGFLAVAAGRLLGVPSVVSLFGGELVRLPEIGYGHQLSLANRWLVRGALAGAGHVTAGSASLARQAAAVVGVERLSLLPLGVDTTRFAPEGDGEAARQARAGARLLHVASLVPIKDQAMLLRAFAQVSAALPDTTLHLVGDGPLRGELARQAAALGVKEQVIFHGAVAHDRLPALYRAADLCLLSSRHESQNLAVLEAAACGVPSVGTAVGVLPELVPAACVVPVGDAAGLAAATLALLRDRGQRRALGEQARARVVQGYTLEGMVARLEAVYGKLRRK